MHFFKNEKQEFLQKKWVRKSRHFKRPTVSASLFGGHDTSVSLMKTALLLNLPPIQVRKVQIGRQIRQSR